MQSLREPLVWSHHPKQLLQGTRSLLQCPASALLPLSLWMPLALFVLSLLFSALISILYLVQVLSRLSTRASSSNTYLEVIFQVLKPACSWTYLVSLWWILYQLVCSLLVVLVQVSFSLLALSTYLFILCFLCCISNLFALLHLLHTRLLK